MNTSGGLWRGPGGRWFRFDAPADRHAEAPPEELAPHELIFLDRLGTARPSRAAAAELMTELVRRHFRFP